MSDKTRKAIAARLERLRAIQKPPTKTKVTVSSKPEKEQGEPQGQS